MICRTLVALGKSLLSICWMTGSLSLLMAMLTFGDEKGVPASQLDVSLRPESTNQAAGEDTPEPYVIPVITSRAPVPELAASWRALDQANAAIVPAPKRFTVIGDPLPWSHDWEFVALEPGYDTGLLMINRRLADLGAPLLAVQSTGAIHRIVAGTIDAFARHGAAYHSVLAGADVKLPRQGYKIEMTGTVTGMVVMVAGADPAGVRYGLVTLSMMLCPGPVLLNARVSDWPDFTYRMSYRLSSLSPDTLARNKWIIDTAFASKINLVFAGMLNFDSLFDDARAIASLHELNQYATERNVRLVCGGYYNVGLAPFPKNQGQSLMHYPYRTEEGLMGHRNLAFTWSRDDLIDARADRLAALMKAAGINAFYLHSQDTGGRDNPENWNLRTPMDRERWGNDRAAADANLQGRFYDKLKAANAEVMLVSVAYPYGASYLKYQDVTDWLKRLSSLLPADAYFCVRENTRESIEQWRSHIRQGMLVYHDPYPDSLRLMFTPAGRTAGTFYFSDRDIYWFCRGQEHGWPAIWVAAEYAWNNKAPGWSEWNAEDYRQFPNVEAAPPEISGPLLSRVTAILFGPAASDAMRRVCLANPSCALPSNPRDYEGPSPTVFFKAKMEAAFDAYQRLTAVENQVIPSGRQLFGIIKNFVAQARPLLAARYYICLARDHVARDEFDAALAASAQARNALADAVDDPNKAALANDLDIGQDITWRQERRRYIAQQPDQRLIRLGVYRRGSGFHQGVLISLDRVPGIQVRSFEDPTIDELGQFDVIMFPGNGDMWDTKEDWRENIRRFVLDGGGVIFSHNAVGRYGGSAFADPVFPDICAGYDAQVVGKRFLRVTNTHPAVGTLPVGRTVRHEYIDHLTVRPGPQGVTLLVDELDKPVMVVGTSGAGRVIYTGQIFGLNLAGRTDEARGNEWRLLYHMVRWTGSGRFDK